MDKLDTKIVSLWLNNGVYFKVSYDWINPYVKWIFDHPDRIEHAYFPALANSFSHIFRPVSSSGSPPIKFIPEETMEQAHQIFEEKFLAMALEMSSTTMPAIEALMLLSAFSRMGVLEPELYENLERILRPNISKLKFGELANIAASFSRVQFDAKELFEEMLPRAKETVAVGSPKEIFYVMQCFPSFRHPR